MSTPEKGSTYEYLQRAPLNNINLFNSSYFLSFSELSQTFNIVDQSSHTFISYGQNDNKYYTSKSYIGASEIFENPYLDFTKHGVLISQSLKLDDYDLTWVASIGQPKISIEEVFHDRSMNTQLSMTLSGSFIPSIQIGWLNEKDSVVGLGSSGAFNFSKNTFKNGKIDRFLSKIPLEKIILETDAPYLSPVPYRGKRNESAYLPLVAQKVCELYGVSTDRLATQTTTNAQKLFRIT